MALTCLQRTLLGIGLVFLVVGFERLLNGYMLSGTEGGPTRLMIGLAFTAAGVLLVGVMFLVRKG